MYIAIILENFDVATRENAEPLTADDFEQFFEVWQKYDDKLTQLITYEELQLLLHQLDEPLHVPLPNRPFITHYQMAMTCDGRIHCLEVIIALIKKVLGDSLALDAMKQAMIQTFQLKCKTTVRYEPCLTTMDYARMDRAARIIQNGWFDYKYVNGRLDNIDGAETMSIHSKKSFQANYLTNSGQMINENGLTEEEQRKISKNYIGTAVMAKSKSKSRLKSALTTPDLHKLGLADAFGSRRSSIFSLSAIQIGGAVTNIRRSLDSLLFIGQNGPNNAVNANNGTNNEQLLNNPTGPMGKNAAIARRLQAKAKRRGERPQYRISTSNTAIDTSSNPNRSTTIGIIENNRDDWSKPPIRTSSTNNINFRMSLDENRIGQPFNKGHNNTGSRELSDSRKIVSNPNLDRIGLMPTIKIDSHESQLSSSVVGSQEDKNRPEGGIV